VVAMRVRGLQITTTAMYQLRMSRSLRKKATESSKSYRGVEVKSKLPTAGVHKMGFGIVALTLVNRTDSASHLRPPEHLNSHLFRSSISIQQQQCITR
jgi:hypothetical protein